jgi:hypothetical protein
MDNILLLVHFCESEGPSALYCTQVVDASQFLEEDVTNANELETNVNSMYLKRSQL